MIDLYNLSIGKDAVASIGASESHSASSSNE
jgi:hypothetical protein